ncbi:MAG TPA: NAD(+) diphosphatase [Sphingomicrobium sp.]|nr:NAD(+) diphosphatase [Sphingomicrobium sp.]
MRPKAFFSGRGLDRADALRAHPEKIAGLAKRDNARELIWRDGIPAMDEHGALQWRSVTDPLLFLGLEGDAPRFSALAEPAGMAFSVLPLIAQLDAAGAPLFAAAMSLARWHSRHRFCANCGNGTELIRGGWSRSCPSCSAEHFPRVDPVVIMLVEHDGKVLLGRQPHYPAERYSALAGFVEVGESIENAVAREVKEEAGVDVLDVRYIASQPWPFPSSLMIGCHAHAQSARLTIDANELEDARWFARDDVAQAVSGADGATFLPPPRTAIARTLLEDWLGLEDGQTRP